MYRWRITTPWKIKLNVRNQIVYCYDKKLLNNKRWIILCVQEKLHWRLELNQLYIEVNLFIPQEGQNYVAFFQILEIGILKLAVQHT